ncbi:type II toxin-antitoxin system HicA family toxin [Pseudomonas citronellolis]|uniref:Type II toxin-antitoxin system HicA family toxin n=1 Tax=Pseudomonas citronellolis TaxID=53408 RepID=A0AAW6P2V9_9PSED|nr:type II toxin-antitoxin system HicA family toxin [Pseudomonas citronellolis]MDF3841025.1 type II toxin-antitoxin system HicA family toxin [Pseudomonas citronellolis]
MFILLRMPHSVLSEADSFARTVVYFGDNQTIFPDHGAKEMGEGLRKKIIKDLGLKD